MPVCSIYEYGKRMNVILIHVDPVAACNPPNNGDHKAGSSCEYYTGPSDNSPTIKGRKSLPLLLLSETSRVKSNSNPRLCGHQRCPDLPVNKSTWQSLGRVMSATQGCKKHSLRKKPTLPLAAREKSHGRRDVVNCISVP